MSRVFGAVYCSIWDDEDFIKLSAAAQRTYLFLTTQPEIVACGSLALTMRRWTGKCSDDAELDVWLAELADAGFVQIDHDEEELLVRTFAKHDRGYLHTVRRKAVIATANAVRSTVLRSTVWTELGKLGVTNVPLDRDSSATTEALRGTEEAPESQRFQVYVSGEQKEPGTGNLERGTVASDEADDPSSPFCPAHQPEGPDGKPCTRCADRSKAIKHAATTEPARLTAVAKAAAAAILACRRCNDQGFIEGPGGELLGKCSHSDLRLVAAVVGREATK